MHGSKLRCPGIVLAFLVVLFGGTDDEAASSTRHLLPDTAGTAYTDSIPGTLVAFEMVRVPGGTVTVETPEGGTRQVSVEPFWMSKTEVRWDAYDVYVYGLDRDEGGQEEREVDAVSYPSKPYVLPGEDFGHQGHPALAMTRKAAEEYARWLSAKTDREYRLPTQAEWKHACLLGKKRLENQRGLGAYAWYEANAEGQTHPVGALEPNGLGLYDLRGNVAEWVAAWSTDAERPPVARGGAYDSDAGEVGCEARRTQTSAWNASDPQLPKSQWWLSDAPFVGFRLVSVDQAP